MPPKQQREGDGAGKEDESGAGGEKRQKGAAAANFQKVVKDVMLAHKFVSAVEPLIRRVVKEEVERALIKYLGSINQPCVKQLRPASSSILQLQFSSLLSLPIFTGAKIEGDGGCSLQLAIVDAITGDATSGPESVTKAEIVVLEGDFEGNDSWTVEEFQNNVIKEREGRRRLLSGDVFVNLNQGFGTINELSFTDNSSWTRSRKFRLGAVVGNGYLNGIRIKEAVTEAFVVKDHRGELYKKHHPPVLEDEVWRLEKIGKDGAFHKRLSKEKINTVKDFLMLLSIDPAKLRNILGSGMSGKMWDATVEHARSCVLNNDMYVYYQDIQEGNGIVLNVVAELKGIMSKQQFVPLAELSDIQKADANKLLKCAYRHREDMRLLDAKAVSGHSSPRAASVPSTLEHSDENLISCSQQEAIFGLPLPPVSTADVFSSLFSMEGSMCDDHFYQQTSETDHDYSSYLLLDVDPGAQLLPVEPLKYLDHDPLNKPCDRANSPADLNGIVVADLFSGENMRKITPKWRILLCVLSWKFSIKRIVALKKTRALENG